MVERTRKRGHRLKRFIAIWILLSAGLNIWQMDRIAELEKKKPMVIYKADNAGDGMASYTRLRFVTTVCSWLRRSSGIK